jgi:hypothetical protein
MLNSVITIKVKERLNKLDSQDYDNIECWQIVEAFNKAQVEWVRRQLHGTNLMKEGDEASTRRIDDLQLLLTTLPVKFSKMHKEIYYTGDLPENYLEWKRLDVYATSGCCNDKRRMTTYLAEVGNVNNLLRDVAKQPNFEWAETFCTLSNNTINVYADNKFEVQDVTFIYYRQPRKIEVQNCVDPYTGTASTANITCEFKDDIIEVLIDEAAAVIAGDIESGNQYSRETENAERNN